jgi:hypothetical protein
LALITGTVQHLSTLTNIVAVAAVDAAFVLVAGHVKSSV